MLDTLTGVDSGMIGGGIGAVLLAMFGAITKAALALAKMAKTAEKEFEARGQDRELKKKHYESTEKYHERMYQHLNVEEAHFARQETVSSQKLDELRRHGEILKGIEVH